MFRSLLSVLLVGSLLWQIGYAATGPDAEPPHPEGEVIILSDEIGPEIDREERARYGLFDSFPNFISATIIQKPGIYVTWVIYEENGQRNYKTLGVTEEVLKLLYEEVQL